MSGFSYSNHNTGLDLSYESFPFLNNAHKLLRSFLTQLGQDSIFSVCIKDMTTKKVCLSNAVCEHFWGIEPQQMIGMTAADILRRVPNFLNVEKVLHIIENRERSAIQLNKTNLFFQVLLSYKGLVQVRQSMIIPLKGIKNRLIATGGLGRDMTHCVDLLKLFALYRYYYPKRHEAAAYFSQYLLLSRYFYWPLSYEELRILLTFMKDTRHKYIAEKLSISPKTVANYLAAIREKLKPEFELYQLANYLRVHRQYISDQ